MNFGSDAGYPFDGEKAYNKRAEMYSSTCWRWLRDGGAIEPGMDLLNQLIAVEYGITSVKGKNYGSILLSPKAEMEDSPDIADAPRADVRLSGGRAELALAARRPA